MANRSQSGNSTSEPPGHRAAIRRSRGWAYEAPTGYQVAFKRWMRIVIIASWGAAILFLLWWQLSVPFQHANAHLLLVSGERNVTDDRASTSLSAESELLLGESERSLLPSDFVAEDFLAFQPLKSQFSLRGKGGTSRPGNDIRELLDLRRLQTNLDDMSSDASDVLVIFLSARSSVEDMKPSIELNVRKGFIDDGQRQLDAILRTIARSEAEVKLLIIDSGRFERDPSRGQVLNEFPLLLERAVAQTNDPSLWVLSSNRSLERSHVSRALERSLFNWFVVLGLNGAADTNRDLQVDLDELSRYVGTEVSDVVRQITGGTESQTPVLLWGGGEVIAEQSFPALVPVTKKQINAVANNDPEQWLQATRSQSVGASVLSVSNGPLTFTPRQDPLSGTSLSPSRISQALSPTRLTGVQVPGLGRIGVNTSAMKTPVGAPGNSAPKPQAPPTPADASTSVKEESPSDASGSDPKVADRKTEPDPKVAIALATLFVEAWDLRDELERNRSDGSNPANSAPEEWRVLLEKMHLQERLFRAARICDHQQISVVVKTIRDGLRALSRDEALPFRTGQDKRTSDLIRRIQDRLKQHPGNAIRAHSFGLTELLARCTGRPIEARLQEIIPALDRFIETGTAEQFQEWVEKLDPAANDFVEIALARRLAAEPGLNWDTKQLALRVCRFAENTASSSLNCAAWSGPEFSAAEKFRKVGERTLLDRVGRDRESEGIKSLRLALSAYQRAATDLEIVRIAELLCDQLTLRLPQYVRWHNESNRHAAGTPQCADIRRLATDLPQLAARLDAPAPGQLIEIQNLSMKLNTLREKIEAGIDSAQRAALTRTSSLPGDHLQMESLLNTTLPTGQVRLGLLQRLIEIDRRNVAQLKLPQIFPAITLNQSHPALDWDWPIRTLELELAVPQLAAVQFAVLQPDFTALSQQWKDLQEASVASSLGRSPHDSDDSIWEKYDRLSSGLRRFYQNWVGQIVASAKATNFPDDIEGRSRQHFVLRGARRGLQFVPLAALAIDEVPSPEPLLKEADTYDLLSWHADRYDYFRIGASRGEDAELAQIIHSCRTQAAMLPHQPPLTYEPLSRIDWDGPEKLSLEAVPEQTIEMQLNWTGAARTPAWISLHFDPEMIDVKAISEVPLTVQGTTSFVEPEITTDRPANFELSSRKPPIVRLTVRGREGAVGQSRLILYAVTPEGTARNEISISLPARLSVEPGIDGVAGSWALADGQLRLHPFANHSTNYTFTLINREPKPREVSLKFLAPRRPIRVDVPQAELSSGDVADFFDRVGPIETLVDVSQFALPGDERPVRIPFPKPVVVPPVPGAARTPFAPIAPNGLLLVVTDRKSDRSLIRYIDIAPQRPRRFLRPQVRYSADRERIEITVVPVDNSLIPPEGVRIVADLDEPLADDAARELDGEIVAPKFEAKLFVGIPRRAGKVVTLRLNVDNYPRAFVFRVPCHANTGNLPEALDRMAVSITSPQPQTAWQSPLNDLPVELQIDVPDGAFQIPGDVVEVGIDRNNDRDFRDEPVLSLNSDRQVEVTAMNFIPDGQFNVYAAISDYKVRVPAAGVRNVNAQLLARVTVSDQTVWSRPVPVIFDGALPRVLKARVSPAGPVVIGGALKLTVGASDNDLSGLARVEAAFDTERTGEIPAAAKLILAQRNPDGSWEAEIPAKDLTPGLHTLLVRAVDRVGNVGNSTKIKLTAVTADDAARLALAPVSINGTVFYGDQPVAGFLVSADAMDGPKILPGETGDDGQFRLNGLLPGKWKVKTEGVLRNKKRSAELEITIKPSESPPPLKFTLK